MDAVMIKAMAEMGALGLCFFMVWTFSGALNKNTRMLERIHGFLTGKGMKDSDPANPKVRDQ